MPQSGRPSAGTKPAVHSTRRRMRAEDRHAQLLRVAIQVAADKGLDRLVHADVAASAGVSTPTVFQYFSDREVLLTSVIGEVDRFYRDMARRCHQPGKPPVERIHDHFASFSDSLDSDRDYAVVWLDWSTHFRNEYGLWDAFVQFQEYVISKVQESVRDGQQAGTISMRTSAADTARLITVASYGVTQLKFMNRGRAIMDRFAEQMLSLTLA